MEYNEQIIELSARLKAYKDLNDILIKEIEIYKDILYSIKWDDLNVRIMQGIADANRARMILNGKRTTDVITFLKDLYNNKSQTPRYDNDPHQIEE